MTIADNFDHKFPFGEFPRLNHFKFDDVNGNSPDVLEEFSKKNSNLEIFEATFFNQKLANVINNHMSKLKNLKIDSGDFKIQNELTIYHVKQFEITGRWNFNSINKLFFPSLKSLKIYYIEKPHADMIAFYGKHCNISHLEILRYDKQFNTDKLNQLNGLENLTKITFRLSEPSNETVNEFMETHQLLNQSIMEISLMQKMNKMLEIYMKINFLGLSMEENIF